MNRRGFFGTLAAIAVAPLVPKRRWIDTVRIHVLPVKTIVDQSVLDGGYLVPKEFEPALREVAICGRLTHAEWKSCKIVNRITLRTIDGQMITRELPA